MTLYIIFFSTLVAHPENPKMRTAGLLLQLSHGRNF